mgnify:CR=1 FL=1
MRRRDFLGASAALSLLPEGMAATAPALRSGGTSPAATMAPTPKKAPWFSDVMIRAIISRA